MKHYTTKEAAEKLGISVRTLRRWVKSGKIKGKVGVNSPEDKFFGAEDKFPVKIVLQRTNSRYERFKPEEIAEKLQMQQRMKKLVVPCDKLSNHMFNYSADEYADILKYRDRCGCVEGVKKGKKIVTPYWLELVEGFEDKLPPDAFAREVLFHAISAYEQGIRIITISTTLDSLSGGGEKRNVYKEQYAAIRGAFDKLAFTRIVVDIEPLLKAYPKYRKNYDGELKLIGTLLPCRFLEGKINGQKTFVIELLGESPLMTVAKLKKQVLTYDATPLAIAEQKNTPQVITVKNYLLRRIKLIKRGLSPIILLKTLYENCGLTDATDSIKQNVRKEIADILSSFKAENVIQNFHFERQGRAYRAIKITS